MSASVRLALARLCAMLFLLVSACADGEREEAEMGKLAAAFKADATMFPVVYAAVGEGVSSRDDIAARAGFPTRNVSVALSKMGAAGQVRKVRRGYWVAIPREQWPADRGKHSTSHCGPDSPTWNGGRYVNDDGYVLVNVGREHPMADARGYVYEHRLVMSNKLGRPLRSDELVHHKDENTQNNADDNLELTTRAWHKVIHRVHESGRRLPGEDNPTIACACRCGETFPKFDRWGRPRATVSGHNRAVRSTEAA